MLFAGLRYDAQDRELPDFVLNRAPFRNAIFSSAGPTSAAAHRAIPPR